MKQSWRWSICTWLYLVSNVYITVLKCYINKKVFFRNSTNAPGSAIPGPSLHSQRRWKRLLLRVISWFRRSKGYARDYTNCGHSTGSKGKTQTHTNSLKPKSWRIRLQFFPNPDQFDPERFAPSNKHNIVPYSYMPFGVGPHNCIGERFGWIQSKLGLFNILKNHFVKPSDRMPTKIEYSPKALFLQTEHGIYINMVRDPLV